MAVDLINNVVRAGGREWPVSLNLATGTLAVHLASETYTVRPLTWGEKRTLARYAFLGEEFLKRQLAAACTTPRSEPEGADEAQALVLAAVWMTAPEGDHLPLSSAALLRATTEIERWSGTPGDELDRQPAADVEALWRSLSAEAPRVMPGHSAAVAAMAPRLASAPVVHADTRLASHPHATTPLAEGWQRILVMPETAEAAHEDHDEASPALEVPIAEPDLESPPHAAAHAEASSQPSAPPRRREPANRFRVTYTSVESGRRPSIATATEVTAPLLGTPTPPQEQPHVATPTETRPAGSRSAMTPPLPTRFYRRMLVDQPPPGTAPTHQPAMPPTPTTPGGADLLDTFAQQLEDAASAVGIDLQG